jgi:hypothetical protein
VNDTGDASREDEEAEEDEADGADDIVLEGGGPTDEAQLKLERSNMR